MFTGLRCASWVLLRAPHLLLGSGCLLSEASVRIMDCRPGKLSWCRTPGELDLQAELKAVCSRDAAINAQLQQEAAKLLASLPA